MTHSRYIKLMLMPVVIGMAALLWSCKSFLQEESPSQHTMDNFYRNTKEITAGLLGVYAQTQSIYQGGSLPITIVGTDELYANNTTGDQSMADRYLYPANANTTTNWYKTHYAIIQSANIIINRAPQVPGISDADLNMITAEAKVIRAWCYFRLVQTFGGLPLVLDETTLFNYRLRRNSIAEVYQSIIDDLSYAAADGVLTEDVVKGRINHWVAEGLLAKVYLTLGTSMTRRPQPIDEYSQLPYDPLQLFGECRDICDKIIASGKYALVNDYGDIFLISRKNGPESMWEIQYSDAPNLGSAWSKNFGAMQQNNSTAYSSNALCGRGYFAPCPSFWRKFKLGDSRRTWSISDYRVTFNQTTLIPEKQTMIADQTIDTGEKCDLDTDDPNLRVPILSSTYAAWMRVIKYRWGVGPDPSEYWKESLSYESSNLPTNVIVLRYADILLMRIEADMLHEQGVAGSVSLDIMNNQLLPRARGWIQDQGRFVTEQEMYDAILTPLQDAVAAAQALYDQAPGDPTLAANLQAAKDALNAKKARCLANYTAATLTYDELMDQRACELCFEFHRWFDLCRTGRLQEVLNRIVNPNAVPKVSFRFDVNYLMPIPTYELDLATDKTLFYQNPGY